MPWLHKTLDVWEIQYGPEHPNTMIVCGHISSAYCSLNAYEKALEYSSRVAAATEKAYGPEHADTLRATALIAKIKALLEQP